MKGKELHDFLRSRRIPQDSLAKKLGISGAALRNKFRTEYLKPDFIKKVSEVVGFDIENPDRHDTSQMVGYISETTHKAIVDGLMAMIDRKDEEIRELRMQLDSMLSGAHVKKTVA